MKLLWFLLLVGGLVFIHELGHFVAARLLEVRVLRASIGFGPRLWSFFWRGTEFAICALPLGGYVRLLGEQEQVIAADDAKYSFESKALWKRLTIIFAGPAANILFALLVFVSVQARRVTARSPVIGTVVAGQPAALADLHAGDRILDIDGTAMRTWLDVHQKTTQVTDRPLRVTVARDDQKLVRMLMPRQHLRLDPLGIPHETGAVGLLPSIELPVIGIHGPKSAVTKLHNFDAIFAVSGQPIRRHDELDKWARSKDGAQKLVTYARPGNSAFGFANLAILTPAVTSIFPERDASKPGLYDYGVRAAEMFVAAVEPRSPAAMLGLVEGDEIVALDGKPQVSWEAFSQALEDRPGDTHELTWLHSDETHVTSQTGTFQLTRRQFRDEYLSESTGNFFGATPLWARRPVAEVVVERQPFQIVGEAVSKMAGVIATMTRVMWLTIIGQTSTATIGGPVLIYHVATMAKERGTEPTLIMAALVSLNLGLLNLLPVPLLDGGQALFVITEAAIRRRLAARTRQFATSAGFLVLLALLMLASYNDFVRYWANPA